MCALVRYFDVLAPAGPTTTTTLIDAARVSCGVARPPSPATANAMSAVTITRCDRRMDARWAPMERTGKSLPPLSRNIAWGTR